jgi:hypothetical protein
VFSRGIFLSSTLTIWDGGKTYGWSRNTHIFLLGFKYNYKKHKRNKRKSKWQSRINNPEKQAILAIRHRTKTNKTNKKHNTEN